MDSKVYITKWWKTRGIVEGQGSFFDGYWSSVTPFNEPGYFFVTKDYGFLTRAEAEADVRSRALKKVASLENQIKEIKRKWLSDAS